MSGVRILWVLLPMVWASCLKMQNDSSPDATITSQQTLSKFIVVADQLEPAFDPFVYQYTLAGGETRRNKLSINAAPVDPKLQIFINDVKLRVDFTTDPMPLVAGVNEFKLELRDGAGTVVNRYNLTVQRVQNLPDEELDDLTASDGNLTPNFAADITSYTLTVGKDTTVLTVSPLAAYPDEASFVINGKSYKADVGGYDVNVVTGTTAVSIEVKGRSGRTKIYTILVTRPAG